MRMPNATPSRLAGAQSVTQPRAPSARLLTLMSPLAQSAHMQQMGAAQTPARPVLHQPIVDPKLPPLNPASSMELSFKQPHMGSKAGLKAGQNTVGRQQSTRIAQMLTHSITSHPMGLDVGKSTVISGHGHYERANGFFNIPEGTSVTVYAYHGASISNNLGNEIELHTAKAYEAKTHTFNANEPMPNYTVTPLELPIKGSPMVVDKPTQLSTLIKPDQGRVHLAHCLDAID